jgi:hypothetical protein
MKIIKNIPDKIYLQVGIDDEPDGEYDFNKLFENGGVTWCNERINRSDIEYHLKIINKN